MELPAPKEIVREDLSRPDFEVERFLLDHSDFQSLADLRAKVERWEQRLREELRGTVNDYYEDFLSTQKTLEPGSESIGSLRLQLLQFQSGVTKELEALAASSRELGAQVQKQKEFAQNEADLVLMIQYLRDLEFVEHKLDDLEESAAAKSLVTTNTGPTSRSNSEDHVAKARVHLLTSLTKTWIGLATLSKSRPDDETVQATSKRLLHIKPRLLKVLNTAIEDIRRVNGDVLPVIVAKSWVLETVHHDESK